MTLTLAALGLGTDLLALPVSEATGVAQGNDRRYPVPASDSVTVDQKAQVLLVRHAGNVFALALACPHQHAAVRWLDKEQRFECTKHHSKDDPDGKYLSGRATRNLDRFPIRKDATGPIVDVSKVWQADKNPNEWASAAVPAI